MSRTPTGRTTQLVGVPIHAAAQVNAMIQRLQPPVAQPRSRPDGQC